MAAIPGHEHAPAVLEGGLNQASTSRLQLVQHHEVAKAALSKAPALPAASQ